MKRRSGVIWILCWAVSGALWAQLPTPLPPPASSPPELAAPPAPIRLSFREGETKAQLMGRASGERPATFLLAVPAGTTITVGVSSPENAARIVLRAPGALQPLIGTAPADGAIRWTGALDAAGDLQIEVTAPGAEIPFRLEANWGAGGM